MTVHTSSPSLALPYCGLMWAKVNWRRATAPSVLGYGQKGIKDLGNKRNVKGGKSCSLLGPPTFPAGPMPG